MFSSLFCRMACLIAILMALMGCRTDVYSQLDERQANQILSVLMERGFQAEKVNQGKNGFTVTVDESELIYALDILEAKGLPQRQFDSLGSVFATEGMISSAMQEKAKFSYAVAEELMNTFNRIDGVLEARVHIVLKEKDPLTQEEAPASAAVFLRHRPDVDMIGTISKVQQIVAQSVPGIDNSDIAVSLFPAQNEIELPSRVQYQNVLGIEINPISFQSLLYLGASLALACFCLGILFAVYLVKRSQRKHALVIVETEEVQ